MRSRRRYTDRRQAYTTGAMIQRRRARARHRNLDKEDNSISGMRWVEDLFRGSFHIVSGSSSVSGIIFGEVRRAKMKDEINTNVNILFPPFLSLFFLSFNLRTRQPSVHRNGKDFILLKLVFFDENSNITRNDASLTSDEYRKINNSTGNEFGFLLNEN